MRLDKYIAEKYGYTRNKAQAFIVEGLVLVDGDISEKPSMEVDEHTKIEVTKNKRTTWVSRSAGKLDAFLSEFNYDVTNKFALDIGSSTGGFTQILLERNVTRVVAVDVGTAQLHESLRTDPKVESYEQTDIRTFDYDTPFDIITIDVSFISLREIIPVLEKFSHSDTYVFLLFKPQFEVGRENLRKTGVPKNEDVIQRARQEFEIFLTDSGYTILEALKASVIGEAGNQEYMYSIKKK